MMKRFLSLCLLFALSACVSKAPDSTVRYTDRGMKRNVVAIAPLYDRSRTHLPWSLSAELTTGVRERVEGDGKVLVLDRRRSDAAFDRLSVEQIFSWEGARYRGLESADYLVLMELLSYQEVPYHKQEVHPLYPYRGQAGTVLCMNVRLRLLDIRGEQPRLVLQQLIPSNHAIPQGLSYQEIDYVHVPWKHPSYLKTPMGKAHSRLARDIAKQVEEYSKQS